MAYTKTSLICLLLMIYMGYFYFSNFTKRHLPLRSTNYFNCYFVSATIVNLFDLLTLITVNKLDTVSVSLNTLLLCLGDFSGVSARKDDVFSLRGKFFNYSNARVDRCARNKYTFHFITSKTKQPIVLIQLFNKLVFPVALPSGKHR